MTPVEGLYLRSRVIHGDLVKADGELPGQAGPGGSWLPYLKLALVALGNLADLEGVIKSIYPTNPHISKLMKVLSSDLQFAKYLRNIFGGHLNEELFAKAYEWRPELRAMTNIRDLSGTDILNLFVLETAINTYVEPDEKHIIFSSETDLLYPNDAKRFQDWIERTIKSAIQVCDWLGTATHSQVRPLSKGVNEFEEFKAAGLTDFVRIKRGR